jgi:hypothetical protein
MQVYMAMALILLAARSVLPYVLTGTARYLFIVVTANLEAVCFFIGWFAADMGILGTTCLAILLGNALVLGVLGSRYGFIMLGLYVVGRLASTRERKKTRLVVVAVLLAVPVLLLFNTVGELRKTQGRGSVDLLTSSAFTTLANSTLQVAKGNDSEESAQGALARLYAWPNAAAVSMTPDPVPYRGIMEWLSEWPSYARIWGGSEDAKADSFEHNVGTMHAGEYGYTETLGSSVEFGVVADGWSTAGSPGVILFAFIVAFCICGAERLVRSSGRSAAGILLLICILFKVCIMCYVYPLLLVIRTLLLTMTIWMVIIKGADAFGNRHIRMGRR